MKQSLSENKGKDLNKIIKLDEARVQNHLDGMVRKTVEETLNDMLNAEAQNLCNAERYQRTRARKDCRAGYYKRKLHTKAGQVELKVPKLRYAKFETAIIERYKRRESSVEEARRGLANVSIQVYLTAIVMNLKRLAAFHREFLAIFYMSNSLG